MNKFRKLVLFVLIFLTVQTACVTLNIRSANTFNIPKLRNDNILEQERQEVLSSKKELIIASNISSEKINPQRKNPKKNKIKMNMAALMTASVLLPGATLLKVSYCLSQNGINFDNWLGLFWVLAIIDFLIDKIPGAATAFQFLQYPMIWLTVNLVLSNLQDNTSIGLQNFFIYAVVIAFQVLKQIAVAAITFPTGGSGVAVVSFLASFIAIRILLNLC